MKKESGVKEKWYTLREVAVKTGLPIEVLKEGVAKGTIQEWKEVHTLLGRQIRISEKALEVIVTTGSARAEPRAEMARKESIPAEQLLERYEEAVHRAGWLEGQLALFKTQSDEEKQRAASVEEAQRKRERELEELSGRIEERLSSARALEASFKEEREEWEGRLRDQARMLFEMEQRLKSLQEQKQVQERIAAGLTGELGALRSEHQQLLNINEELTGALKKSHKQWKLWK